MLASLQCLNLTQLLQYYGLNPDSPISPSQFTYLCPALLYQIDSRVCIRHDHQMVEQEPLEPLSTGEATVYDFIIIGRFFPTCFVLEIVKPRGKQSLPVSTVFILILLPQQYLTDT